MQRGFVWMALLALGAVSAPALWTDGLWGIFEYQLRSWAGRQVLLDLTIALALVWFWLWKDARSSGRNPWPWLLLTLVAGSFGPLLYLATRRASAPTPP